MRFYSDDPVRDYERYDRYLQKQLEKLPVCEECNCPIQGDVYRNEAGEEFCEECWDTFYRQDDDE